MLRIICGDALEKLRELEDGCVQCCVTSPPYWGLRDYGVAGQMGLEKTPEEYVAKMVEVFAEVRRVLRDDGTVWLNLGDTYFSNGGSRTSCTNTLTGQGARREAELDEFRKVPEGYKPKDLIGIPWRVAFALQADGWYLRSDIIWHKPNPMPESVTDRPTKAHEYVFLLSKSQRYFYDAEAIKEPADNAGQVISLGEKSFSKGQANGANVAPSGNVCRDSFLVGPTRNRRTVWTVPTAPYSGAHFATFPPKLIEPCILAGTSAKGCCPKCGAGWERVVEKSGGSIGHSWHDHSVDLEQGQRITDPTAKGSIARCKDVNGQEYKVETKGWQPTCNCAESNIIPCTVIDPFSGSGTTGMVAIEAGRKAILIELNPAYIELARKRCNTQPILKQKELIAL